MAAALVCEEELTVTAKSSVLETNMVVIVITVEGYIKLVEAEAFAFFSVALGFFNLPDHPIVHFFTLLVQRNEKGTQTGACLSRICHRVCPIKAHEWVTSVSKSI